MERSLARAHPFPLTEGHIHRTRWIGRWLRSIEDPDAYRARHGSLPPSLAYGSAGIAYGFYRLSVLHDSTEYLQRSASWLKEAQRAARVRSAFWEDPNQPDPAVRISMAYGPAGVELVRALIADTGGRTREVADASKAFVRYRSKIVRSRLDLFEGAAGLLVGAAQFRALVRHRQIGVIDRLAHPLRIRLLRWVRRHHPAHGKPTLLSLGAAHGWTGLILALMAWHRARETRLPISVLDKMRDLAALAGRMSRTSVAEDYAGGWCRGNGGALTLWSNAVELMGEAAFLRAGNATAHVAVANRPCLLPLCCGVVGQAHGLLAWYRATGESRWLKHARTLADYAVKHQPASIADPAYPDSLFTGRMGTVLLRAELEQPDQACFPLLEGLETRSRRLQGAK